MGGLWFEWICTERILHEYLPILQIATCTRYEVGSFDCLGSDDKVAAKEREFTYVYSWYFANMIENKPIAGM